MKSDWVGSWVAENLGGDGIGHGTEDGGELQMELGSGVGAGDTE